MTQQTTVIPSRTRHSSPIRTQHSDLVSRCLAMLRRWAIFAERDWYVIPNDPSLGCYGSGYGEWGVQTTQKYVAAIAVLAKYDGDEGYTQRALAALRYTLRTHQSGDLAGTDGSKWGHTWISALGIERMMHGVDLLRDHMNDEDAAHLRAVMISEADWLATRYHRGPIPGIQANLWGESGGNHPESNIWNGALLWRVSVMYPEHSQAGKWRDVANRFLVNGVSVASDALDKTIVAGRPVSDWNCGANYFPNYALDHHSYFNIGYMVLCASNAAILHFDLLRRGVERPEALDHHQVDLWHTLRRFIFTDGRLARLGGDTRMPYTYAQDYLLPALLYASDHHEDRLAEALVEPQVRLIEHEAEYSGDGGFYSRRLVDVAQQNPYYYTRLESDRACVLSMMAVYWPLLQTSTVQETRDRAPCDSPVAESYENSVAGGWIEPDYGAICHRSAGRLASFAWRANGLAQGMCQPPDDGSLADWRNNLCGYVRFADDSHRHPSRRLGQHMVKLFDGGFLAAGVLAEGVDLFLYEGWRGTNSASHWIAVAALPDGVTMIGMQVCQINACRRYIAQVKGLCLNLPNDLYNDGVRRLYTASQTVELTRPLAVDEQRELKSRWVNIEKRIGVVGVYGADTLTVDRPAARQGEPYGSLWREQVCWPFHGHIRSVDPGEIVLDAGWAVLSGVNAAETQRVADATTACSIQLGTDIRAMSFPGQDGRTYVLAMNPSHRTVQYDPRQMYGGFKKPVILASDSVTEPTALPAGGACLLAL